MSSIVEFILEQADFNINNAPFSGEDIENASFPVCNCGNRLEEIDVEDMKCKHIWLCPTCERECDTEEEALKCCIPEKTEGTVPKEYWKCPICGELCETEEEARECCAFDEKTVFYCPDCEECTLIGDADTGYAEIYEWYSVDDFFADELAKQGEVVIRGYNNFWGRQTFGSSIYMDPVFTSIAKDMEILDGMKYEWK